MRHSVRLFLFRYWCFVYDGSIPYAKDREWAHVAVMNVVQSSKSFRWIEWHRETYLDKESASVFQTLSGVLPLRLKRLSLPDCLVRFDDETVIRHLILSLKDVLESVNQISFLNTTWKCGSVGMPQLQVLSASLADPESNRNSVCGIIPNGGVVGWT